MACSVANISEFSNIKFSGLGLSVIVRVWSMIVGWIGCMIGVGLGLADGKVLGLV